MATRKAKEIGASLPHTSLWKVLKEEAEIHKPLFSAFLHACGIPDHLRPLWEEAWERANGSRLSLLELNKAMKEGTDSRTMVRILERLHRV